MSDIPSVVINGVTYVPATSAVANVDAVMQPLYESYMGAGEKWSDTPYNLWVQVNEDGEGITLQEFAAEIARHLVKKEDS